MKFSVMYTQAQTEQIQTFINETYGNGKEGLIGHEIKSEYVHTDVMTLDTVGYIYGRNINGGLP